MAQITRVTGADKSIVTFPPGAVQPSGRNVVRGAGVLTDANGSGASYNTSVQITPAAISFEAGNAVLGPAVKTQSLTSVDLVLVNNADAVVAPQLHSSIIPAGMGFYLADISAGCEGNPYTGCPQSQSGAQFSDLSAGSSGPQDALAFAGFEFSVISEGVTLYQVNASMTLNYDPVKGVIVNTAVARAASLLNGFTQTTPLGSTSAMGFAWDTTDFVVSLGSLGIGQSRKLTYVTSVETYSRTPCINSTTCLVAYSGFGDPIGRGGGTSFARFASAGPTSGITGVNFQPVTFNRPTYRNGTLTFLTGGGSGAVPEPGAWALMLVGFGVLGVAVRRRRASLVLS